LEPSPSAQVQADPFDLAEATESPLLDEPRKTNAAALAIAVVVGCLLLFACIGVLVWFRSPGGEGGEGGAGKGGNAKNYTREVFQKKFLGARADEVRAELGAPSLIQPPAREPGATYWRYEKITTDSKTGKTDLAVYLWFEHDRVTLITY
jgi:hypothetical protein